MLWDYYHIIIFEMLLHRYHIFSIQIYFICLNDALMQCNLDGDVCRCMTRCVAVNGNEEMPHHIHGFMMVQSHVEMNETDPTIMRLMLGVQCCIVLPSFRMLATISLCFEGSFANIYLFHIFRSASACMCLQWLLPPLLPLSWLLRPSLNSNHKLTVNALSLAWGGR